MQNIIPLLTPICREPGLGTGDLGPHGSPPSVETPAPFKSQLFTVGKRIEEVTRLNPLPREARFEMSKPARRKRSTL